MADYWKSQPRHFCEFCKCWTADNKPSRDFHERGKRHQENVKKKLDELRKKGLADAKREKETSSYLKQMEKGALLKLKQDLKQDPKLASQYGVVLKTKTDKVATATPDASDTSGSSVGHSTDVDVENGEWCEAITDEGYAYYWNTVTKESRWELPENLSQKSAKPPAVTSSSTAVTSSSIAVSSSAAVSSSSSSSSPAAGRVKTGEPLAKKKKKCTAVKSDVTAVSQPVSNLSTDNSSTQSSTSQQCSVYGAWKAVEPVNEPVTVDLQLPTDTNHVELKTVVTISSEPKIKFREKKMTYLGTTGSNVGFRKSKFGANRSIRSTDCSEDN